MYEWKSRQSKFKLGKIWLDLTDFLFFMSRENLEGGALRNPEEFLFSKIDGDRRVPVYRLYYLVSLILFICSYSSWFINCCSSWALGSVAESLNANFGVKFGILCILVGMVVFGWLLVGRAVGILYTEEQHGGSRYFWLWRLPTLIVCFYLVIISFFAQLVLSVSDPAVDFSCGVGRSCSKYELVVWMREIALFMPERIKAMPATDTGTLMYEVYLGTRIFIVSVFGWFLFQIIAKSAEKALLSRGAASDAPPPS